ncbi:MAG: dihydroorotase [Proteobacteria bacterium]|nr:MAG: dihydroorotase [Pseudomonadota bacterium]PIE40228.1 MAG: dihydroorotase [Gammaproteobacteria bacterium]
MSTLVIDRPDDWHLHLRDGPALKDTVAASARYFGRAVVMPNLTPPVASAADALVYYHRIVQCRPDTSRFAPLMTLYLTDNTTPEEIDLAANDEKIVACKLYPAGATTNSDSGVTNIEKVFPILERMAEKGLLLLVHGEVTTNEVDIFDREKQFIAGTLSKIVSQIPDLKVVLEHITTKEAVEFVQSSGQNLAATITPHHLLFNRNHMLVGGIRPHFYCLPILKRNTHQQALQEAATSGNPKFFLGTDSAPHVVGKKESVCGCAGCFSAYSAIELYAEVFDSLGALDKLEAFASHYGPDFYGMPRNRDKITLVKEPWVVPNDFSLGADRVIPVKAGETLQWQVKL